MRTSITLDDDLADELKRLQAKRGITFRRTIETVLSIGLERIAEQENARHRFPTAALGRAAVSAMDSIPEALGTSEGWDFR